VQTRLAPSRKLAYTTVMTLLDRLAKRGFVSRTRSGRMFIYGAVLSKDKAREAAVQALLDVWFGGSRQELANYLGGVAVQAVPEPHPQPPVDEPIDTTLL
jgi:predicted transcriptional regulator